jgi:hypothetical protein
MIVAQLLVVACASPVASDTPADTPPFSAVLREARSERLVTDWIEVTELELGSIRSGPSTFSARVRNLTTEPQRVGLDLRTEPGLWYLPRQKQYSLEVPPGEARRFEASYGWSGVGSQARLRVRFAKASVTSQGGLKLATPDLERWYEVGNQNPAVPRPGLQTEHLDIYVEKGSLSESRIEEIGRQREGAIREIEGLLGVRLEDRVNLVFYADPATKTWETGHVGHGLARDGLIVEVYNAGTEVNPFHEIAHVVSRVLGHPPALFSEGFAIYVSERLGAQALDIISRHGQTIDQTVCAIANSGALIPLDELFDYDEIGSDESRPAIAYPQAGSVVKHLMDAGGLDRFRQAYARLQCCHGPSERARNREEFTRLFGHTVSEVEQRWRASWSCTPAQ